MPIRPEHKSQMNPYKGENFGGIRSGSKFGHKVCSKRKRKKKKVTRIYIILHSRKVIGRMESGLKSKERNRKLLEYESHVAFTLRN